MLRIRAFWAPDDQETGRAFAEGHAEVLLSIGITKVTSASDDWISSPFVYVLVVEDTDNNNKILGGARLHIAGPGHPLPMEEAIKRVDPNVEVVIAELAEKGTAEVCGLWNAKEIAGMGIGVTHLSWACVALTRQLKLDTLVALVAHHTYRMGARKGFRTIQELGDRGRFNYPKLDLVATAVCLRNPKELPEATEEEREAMLSLRANPQQVRTMTWPKGTFDLQFDLLVKNPDWRTLSKTTNQQ